MWQRQLRCYHPGARIPPNLVTQSACHESGRALRLPGRSASPPRTPGARPRILPAGSVPTPARPRVGELERQLDILRDEDQGEPGCDEGVDEAHQQSADDALEQDLEGQA